MLKVYRVPYGKESTPEEDREYHMLGSSCVGTKEEWKAFAKKTNQEPVEFHEKE